MGAGCELCGAESNDLRRRYLVVAEAVQEEPRVLQWIEDAAVFVLLRLPVIVFCFFSDMLVYLISDYLEGSGRRARGRSDPPFGFDLSKYRVKYTVFSGECCERCYRLGRRLMRPRIGSLLLWLVVLSAACAAAVVGLVKSSAKWWMCGAPVLVWLVALACLNVWESRRWTKRAREFLGHELDERIRKAVGCPAWNSWWAVGIGDDTITGARSMQLADVAAGVGASASGLR